MVRLPIGEHAINYAIDGDGPWLTLLHGFSHNLHIWEPQVERLADAFRVLRVDLRGHGGSTGPENGYGPVEYTHDVLELLDALAIGATHVWGTHTGAAVGLMLAALHPERVATLALEGAVIPGTPSPVIDDWQVQAREIAQVAGSMAAKRFWFERAPFATMRERATELRAIEDGFSGAPWLATGPSLPAPDIRASLKSIRHRTIIVNGANDLPEFLDTAALLERALPHARRYIVPNAGAFPAWDIPDAVTALVAQFLEAEE